ncbi:MAG TPA: class I SAM-dependent methyltransferase [Gemmatimonadaceae bacterium]|nr:class I SAM-dependent methyltransferase [Gemmatimonadaceae bacterium]
MSALRSAARAAAPPTDYEPFPNAEGRNVLQASLEIPALVRILRVPTRQRILEVGCGRGVGLVALARLCEPASLTGLDISAELLGAARERLARAETAAELHQGDVRSLPFPAESFDIVIDFGTCYHIANPACALAEIARVLRPGGKFIHETPLAQLLAHPLRTRGRSLPWRGVPELARGRTAGLWAVRVKRGDS